MAHLINLAIDLTTKSSGGVTAKQLKLAERVSPINANTRTGN